MIDFSISINGTTFAVIVGMVAHSYSAGPKRNQDRLISERSLRKLQRGLRHYLYVL